MRETFDPTLILTGADPLDWACLALIIALVWAATWIERDA